MSTSENRTGLAHKHFWLHPVVSQSSKLFSAVAYYWTCVQARLYHVTESVCASARTVIVMALAQVCPMQTGYPMHWCALIVASTLSQPTKYFTWSGTDSVELWL